MTVSTRALRDGGLDHELLWTAVGTLAAVMAWGMVRTPGPLSVVGCVFKAVTGVPCPTCGATRAIEALAEGRVLGALWLNPLVTAVVLAWIVYAAYGVGAIAGAWPRVAVRLDGRECTALRMISIAVAFAGWIFLVIGGR